MHSAIASLHPSTMHKVDSLRMYLPCLSCMFTRAHLPMCVIILYAEIVSLYPIPLFFLFFCPTFTVVPFTRLTCAGRGPRQATRPLFQNVGGYSCLFGSGACWLHTIMLETSIDMTVCMTTGCPRYDRMRYNFLSRDSLMRMMLKCVAMH